MPRHFYRFGEFRLDAEQKVLLRHEKPLLLAPKVVETLLTLVQNSGRIIEKEELMTRSLPRFQELLRVGPDQRRGVGG